MENFILDKDIRVFYITAKSFPDGIADAFHELHSLLPASQERILFGISRPENGVIVYRAAAEETTPGEAARLNLETLIIRKGQYISIVINDYRQDIQNIGKAFKILLAKPGIDPEGYCVEWYGEPGRTGNDKDVRCMVRLND